MLPRAGSHSTKTIYKKQWPLSQPKGRRGLRTESGLPSDEAINTRRANHLEVTFHAAENKTAASLVYREV